MAGRKKESGVSKKQIAYEKIKEMILDGAFSKESPLVERQLCDMIGISRTPIREALRELANDGLVEVIDGKGVYVKKIGFRDMIEIFEMREALEGMAVRLFVERAEQEAVDLLQKYMDEQEDAYNKEEHELFMNIDMKIHNQIASGAKNQRLKTAIINIYDQITQIAVSARDDKKVRDMAIESHRKIMRAVLARDSEAAQQALVDHVVEMKRIHMERYYLL